MDLNRALLQVLARGAGLAGAQRRHVIGRRGRRAARDGAARAELGHRDRPRRRGGAPLWAGRGQTRPHAAGPLAAQWLSATR